MIGRSSSTRSHKIMRKEPQLVVQRFQEMNISFYFERICSIGSRDFKLNQLAYALCDETNEQSWRPSSDSDQDAFFFCYNSVLGQFFMNYMPRED